jgi:hypothetical protein
MRSLNAWSPAFVATEASVARFNAKAGVIVTVALKAATRKIFDGKK